VTSRARLQLEGETVVPIGPLGLTGSREAPSEAITLLLDRVRRLRRDADFAGEDAARLETIVQQLDGLPLAIELAAPRIAFLGTKTLLELLEERFAILTGRTSHLRRAWSSVPTRTRTKAAMPIAGFFVIGAATGTRIAEDGASASPVDGNR
jgi:predicted ATPase